MDFLGRSQTVYGIATGLSTFFGLFLTLILGRLSDNPRMTQKVIIMYTFVAQTLSFTGLLILQDPILLAINWTWPLYPGLFVGGPAVITDLTQKNNRGRGMVIFNAFINLGRGIGPLFATLVVISFSILQISPLTLYANNFVIIISKIISVIGGIAITFGIKSGSAQLNEIEKGKDIPH